MKRIGILTGGGDVPGLNSVIKGVVYRGHEMGCEVIGIRRGWEGLTHVDLDDADSQGALHPAAEPREHAHGGPHGRHVPAHQPHEPAEDESRPRVSRGEGVPRPRRRPRRASPRRFRHDLAGAGEPGAAGHRVPGRHRRRRHAQLRGAPGQVGRQSHRHPQDDGQRRAQHRVLHRLFDRHHARARGHRAAAHHGRLARAHRAVPRLRARRRATRRSTPPTSRRSAAASRSTSSTWRS